MTDMDCSACGKSVVRLEVREGEKLFHLECYVFHKRPSPLTTPDTMCVLCLKPIRPTDDKTTIQHLPYHSSCRDRKTRVDQARGLRFATMAPRNRPPTISA